MAQTQYGWFNLRPSILQFINTPQWLLLVLCSYFFTLSMVINGTYSVSVSTIEKRFGLSSSVMGVITSMYDVACLLVTAFVSYYGGQQSKARWLGAGLLVLAMANLVFISPHFIGGNYQAADHQLPDVCPSAYTDEPPTGSCDEGTTPHSGHFWYYSVMFCAGMFLIGIAGSPLYVLGVAYLDESIKRAVAPIYIGLFGASGTIGSTCGFLLGGVFLSLYVDMGVDTNLTSGDPRWVGNWWMGNVIGMITASFLALWMCGFPKTIPKRPDKRNHVLRRESEGSDESNIFQMKSSKMTQGGIGKLPSATKELFSTPGYVFLCLGSSCEYFVVSAAMAFFPKVIYVLYNTPLSELSWLYGTAVVLPILAGQIVGAYINKRLELDGIAATKTVCIVTLMSLIVATLYSSTTCPAQEIVGLTQPLNNSSQWLVLPEQCNASYCDCTQWHHFPVCDEETQITYRSPCVAKCSQMNDNEKVFAGCQCSKSDVLSFGKCHNDCVSKAAVFVFLTALFGFTSFLSQTPTVIAVLRSVPNHLKAYSLGWQMTIIRLLGAIPGPIIYGKLIDTTCILWQDKCGSHGNCLEYDNEKLIYVTTVVAVVAKFFTALFFVLAWKCQKPPEARTAVTNNGRTITADKEDSLPSDTILLGTEV